VSETQAIAAIKDILCPGMIPLAPDEIVEAVRSLQADNERLRSASLVEIQQAYVKSQIGTRRL